ncbi:MAG TPA: isocitrate/isopropylmalate dehydrogenase family protein [Vicinamibacteria bacterium]|nr:isocitrate/isopropylmalate dehydrogenase family protein [Vicinamibacteria bacterium]
MAYRITLIPGDGIGPEITDAVISVLDATRIAFEWDRHEAGIRSYEKTGNPLPPELLDSIRRNKVAIKGPLTTLVGEGFPSANVALRKELDLYANLRPVRTVEGVPSRYENINLVIVRENTEDLYSGIEHMIMPGVSQGLKVITSHASSRIARFAFEYAMRRGRKKVTAVHKANIMKLTDGLFLESARNVAKEYPAIEFDHKIVDNLAMQLVLDPNQFDVLLLSNLYGDIISDLCAGLVGGLGMVPAANIGEKYAVFEAVHGSAPDLAGKGIANPTALLFSGVLMLRHLGENDAADRLLRAAFAVLRKGEIRTPDLGGSASTTDYARAVTRELEGA